jgi:hypothetical protein
VHVASSSVVTSRKDDASVSAKRPLSIRATMVQQAHQLAIARACHHDAITTNGAVLL